MIVFRKTLVFIVLQLYEGPIVDFVEDIRLLIYTIVLIVILVITTNLILKEKCIFSLF